MFLRSAWYPAAWEREIGDSPHGVRLLGEDVAIFRLPDGTYGAVDEACPHRRLPLSMGTVCGSRIECGYHGMQFDANGRCRLAPTNGTVPNNADIHGYPAVARYGLVWLWMGDPAAADPADVFPVEHWDDPAWGTTDGDDMVVECNYLFIVDNLLDPSHVAWVHLTSFAGQGSDSTPLETTINDDGVATWRWMFDGPAAPFYAPYLPFEGNCDRKQLYEVRYPSHALIRAYFSPAGTGGEGRELPADQTFLMDSYNFLTPIDERRTRYFWFQQRNVLPDDAEVSRRFAASVRSAFEEDKRILGAVQAGMDRHGSEVNLRSDVGGVRFRRRLDQLIAAEQKG